MARVTSGVAVDAMRHVIQEHGDSVHDLRRAGDASMANWIGRILGMGMPASYLEVLALHDGLGIDGTARPLFGLMQSMETFAVFRDRWSEPKFWWPIAGDGCGNYYVLSNGAAARERGESPVAFVDCGVSSTEPAYWVASSYAHFVFFNVTSECAARGCTVVVKAPRKRSWPFDADFVLEWDPDLDRVQPRDRWPK